ncbi:MAG: hypothetical protein ACOC9J_00025 [Persicimonas sp.]
MRHFATLCLALAFALTGCASPPAADDAERPARCPEGRYDEEFPCPRLVTWARDPDSGQCCRYEAVCASPTGWKTYATKADCEESSRDD